jgi:hypothetical protein
VVYFSLCFLISYFFSRLFLFFRPTDAPPSWLRRTGNVVFESEQTMGGHFAAHEVPELLVGDLRKMFGRGGPAYGVVGGRSGY